MYVVIMERRPIQTRTTRWAKALAAGAARLGFSPNGISLLGIGVSLLGAAAVVWGGRAGWIGGAVAIQARLLCNMLDGLVAVEHGRKSPLGELFNEVPDRIEDLLFLVAAGLAIGVDGLGWLCGLLALCTAYVRLLGGSLGFEQDFRGPLAKPQRMFWLTVVFLIAGVSGSKQHAVWAVSLGLAGIALGTLFTLLRRLTRLAGRMREAT